VTGPYHRRVRRRLLAIAAVIALLLVPAASAKTVNLNWREQAVLDGQRVLRIRVDALAFEPGRWAVRLSFTNLAPRTLTVVRNNFALVLYPPGARDPCRFDALRATSFWPTTPRELQPGETWRGVFGGKATLPSRGSLRVLVSWFSGGPPSIPRFGWLTDHTYDLGVRRGRLAPTRTCR
jgi:hypothetical protein